MVFALRNRGMKRVVVIEGKSGELAELEGFLREKGYVVVAECGDGNEAVELCRKERPDIVIMDTTTPGVKSVLASRCMIRDCPSAIVLLAEGCREEEEIKEAIAAGVMAYLTKPVRKEELLGAIELATSRFREFEKLKKENEDLKKTLEARKLIEKAKGLLMEKEGITEAEAFSRIRKISMDKRKPMKDVAEVIILALEKRTN